MSRAVCIIPARGGSQRIPRKNIRDFHGKPIIAYSILAALKSKLFELVFVSTDCEQIADVAESHGAVVHMRDAEHSADAVGTQAVARHVLDQLAAGGLVFDLACVIYATAPMISVVDLERARDELIQRKAVFSMSVGGEPLHDAAQFYWGHEIAFDTLPLIDAHTVMFPIAAERVCDINTEDDWRRAEDMYTELVRSGRLS